MTNAEKHIEKLLSWYKEAVTENGVCYLTCDDKNTLAYALKCCKHYEDIKKDIDTWMLREEPSSSEKPNKSESPTGSNTKKCTTCAFRKIDGKPHEMCKFCVCGNRYRQESCDDCISRFSAKQIIRNHYCSIPSKAFKKLIEELDSLSPVTPVSPKGHWIEEKIGGHEVNVCSHCQHIQHKEPTWHYCPLCGADMSEVEE